MYWLTFGFEQQKSLFERLLANGELGHAYLFTGQDMIGKRTFAKELAAKITDPHDIIELSSSNVEEVRDAKKFLSLSPLNGAFKILIVDNADRLTEEAQNALLKLIEEPSGKAILFFVTSKPSALLTTIISRCQFIFFPTPDHTVVSAYLKNKDLTAEQIAFLSKFSNGSIGLLADDFGKIKKYIEEFSGIMKADINKRFDLAKKLSVDEELKLKILYWMLYLRSKNIYKPLPNLLELHRTVSYTGYNEQLALENFMLTM